MRTRLLHAVVAMTAAASMLAGGTGHATNPGCADASDGGDWAQYGHDLFNTRSQPDEHVIGATNAAALAPKWYLKLDSSIGFPGSFQTTPAVAGGCVYIATDDAVIASLNADTGALNWKVQLPVDAGGYGGKLIASPAVDGGHVFLSVSEYGNPTTGKGPYVASLNAQTGATEWMRTLDTNAYAYANASPVVFDGMIFAGFAGLEDSPRARGGYAILDEESGQILAKRYTINDADYAKGYGGASIWSTAAIDTEHGYAYVGSGNPSSKKIESELSNALLKIDVDPSRASFGDIVASFKGNADSYSATLGKQPACDLLGDKQELQYYETGVWSVPCAQLDLDFGASPNLFRTADGTLLVGDLQKSGVYHAANASTMMDAFDLPVAPPCFACNAASPSTAGDKIFVAAAPPGQLFGLDGTQEVYSWAAPLADGLHYQPISNANGVVYVVDGSGILNMIDAATGLPIARKDLATDSAGGSADSLTSSAGIAIARHKLYVASGQVLVVYA